VDRDCHDTTDEVQRLLKRPMPLQVSDPHHGVAATSDHDQVTVGQYRSGHRPHPVGVTGQRLVDHLMPNSAMHLSGPRRSLCST
jgi:hypothetical protein